VIFASQAARAEDKRRVSISVDKCGLRMADEIGRIAAIELHAERVPASESAPDVTRIDVTCESSSDTIALHVTDPLTSKDVARKVSVAGIDERAHARTIALAVAELVSASWVELETTPEPKVQPIPQRVVEHSKSRPIGETAAPKPKPHPSSSPPIVFEAVAGARVFFESREPLLGGGAAIEPWLSRTILLRFDGFVEHARTSRRPGEVDIDTVSTAAAVGIGTSAGNVRLTGTLGLRAGYARLVGLAKTQNVQGQVIEGPWVGPELRLGVELGARAHVHLVIDWAAGWALAGVVGPVPTDRDVLAQGPYGAVAIGFAAN
jgi:hypothetical protein